MEIVFVEEPMATTNQGIQLEVNPRMSLAELSQTVEFGHLSPKMAVWVRTYVQSFLDTGTFDPLVATQAAYECTTEASARTFGYQLLAHPKIILVLNRFFGTSQERASIRQVERAISNRRLSVAQIQALRLYSDLQGWSSGIKCSGPSKPKAESGEPHVIDRGPTEGPPKFYVGQRVTQRDDEGVLHTGQVLAIDAEGKPTQIEEIA
jgi:hypothetical protein